MSNFTSAIIAAVIIAVVSAVVEWLLGVLGIRVGGGIIGAIVWLIISAVVLIISARILPGFAVEGFTGAIIAAIAIAVLYWIINLIFPGATSPMP